MRHVEGCRLVSASIGSAADRGQSAALHPDVPAALLVRARRHGLRICRKGQAGQRNHREEPDYCLQLVLLPVDKTDNGGDEPESSGRPERPSSEPALASAVVLDVAIALSSCRRQPEIEFLYVLVLAQG